MIRRFTLALGLLAALTGSVMAQKMIPLLSGSCPGMVKVGGSCPTVDLNFATNRAWVKGSGFVPFTSLLSLSRASTETVTWADGHLTYAASGQLAISDLGLQVYEARTNIRLNSQTFAGAQTTNSGITVSDNAFAALDGTTTAASFSPSATNAPHANNNTTALAATIAPWTASIYVKANVGRWFGLGFGAGTQADGAFFDLLNGVVGTVAGGTTATITNTGKAGWYRITVTKTLSAVAVWYLQIEPHSSDNEAFRWNSNGTQSFYVWGAQLEAGAFPTPYIPITTVALARNADSIVVGGSLATLLASSRVLRLRWLMRMERSCSARLPETSGQQQLAPHSARAIPAHGRAQMMLA